MRWKEIWSKGRETAGAEIIKCMCSVCPNSSKPTSEAGENGQPGVEVVR